MYGDTWSRMGHLFGVTSPYIYPDLYDLYPALTPPRYSPQGRAQCNPLGLRWSKPQRDNQSVSLRDGLVSLDEMHKPSDGLVAYLKGISKDETSYMKAFDNTSAYIMRGGKKHWD